MHTPNPDCGAALWERMRCAALKTGNAFLVALGSNRLTTTRLCVKLYAQIIVNNIIVLLDSSMHTEAILQNRPRQKSGCDAPSNATRPQIQRAHPERAHFFDAMDFCRAAVTLPTRRHCGAAQGETELRRPPSQQKNNYSAGTGKITSPSVFGAVKLRRSWRRE